MDGKWIVEMSELSAVRKAEVEDMRRFLTRRDEKFRPAYGRVSVHRPRRCVFAGSTNSDDYLKDPTGERRFWIVKCINAIDLVGLTGIRDMLWGEAFAAYVADENWYLDDQTAAIAKQEQIERVDEDAWLDQIDQLVGDLREIAIDQVMDLMAMERVQRNRASKGRIVTCLLTLGFRRAGKFNDRGDGRRNKVRFSRDF